MLEHIKRGTNPDDSAPTVVMCHGFGADALDLAPLSDELGHGLDLRWIFPQAPYRFQMGWGEGRAWFPRDPLEIQTFMSGATLPSLGLTDPTDLGLATQELVELLDGSNCIRARTVLGGFSQGAMVAAATVLERDIRPAGLLLFSGSIIASSRLGSLAAKRRPVLEGLPVLQFHGTEDPVLPYGSGRELSHLLESAGADVQFNEFPGGHGIPGTVFGQVRTFLAELLDVSESG